MSDESGEKKSPGGHIAIALAGLGALFARTADDCGRIAAKSGSAFKASASLGDDAVRAGSKVGSLADDAARAGKYGALAEDGARAGKYGSLADDGLRNGKGFASHGDGSLIEEASHAGASAESHLGDVAETGVDVSLEILQNLPADADDDQASDSPSDTPSVTAAPDTKFNTMALLKARSSLSQPALLPVMPAMTKAFLAVLGRPDKPGERGAFTSLQPTPNDGVGALDPIRWLKGRLSHNPITMVFYTTDRVGTQVPIPLVLPNGEMSDDTIMHRACVEHFSHCILLICKPEKAGYKEPCAKSAVDAWQTVAIDDPTTKLSTMLEKLVVKRATTAALQEVTISRVDVSKDVPRIVRSRLTVKKP